MTGAEAADPDGHRTVRSADGTPVGVRQVGSGPVRLVVVHGALSAGDQWLKVASALAESCTCWVMDRSGRGLSGVHADYSIQREVEDIEAVLRLAGPGAHLLGHSAGGIYSLEVSLRTPVESLILYEPPLHAFRGRFATDVMVRIREAAREGRFDDVVSIFLAEEVMVPDDVLEEARESSSWQHRVALAPPSVREWDELERVGLTADRYRSVAVPTLLLAGTETLGHPSFATAALAAKLPDTRTVLLHGQGHSANLTAPELVAREVRAFLEAVVRGTTP